MKLNVTLLEIACQNLVKINISVDLAHKHGINTDIKEIYKENVLLLMYYYF